MNLTSNVNYIEWINFPRELIVQTFGWLSFSRLENKKQFCSKTFQQLKFLSYLRWIWKSTYLSIICPQFKGQDILAKSHLLAVCSRWSFLGNLFPHSHTISTMVHASSCKAWSWRLKLLPHKLHLISIRGHFLMCSAEVSKLKWSLQAMHSPWKVESRLQTKMFLQKFSTCWRHIAQASWPVVFLNWATQNPQKLWPHGVAMCASRMGFVLEKENK